VKATEVTVGQAESNGSLLPGIWRDSLHVTCGLTVCTPGSAPGPTLGNEYGKTLPLTVTISHCLDIDRQQRHFPVTFIVEYTYNRSYCELCGRNTVNIFSSVNWIVLPSPDEYFFNDYFKRLNLARHSLSLVRRFALYSLVKHDNILNQILHKVV